MKHRLFGLRNIRRLLVIVMCLLLAIGIIGTTAFFVDRVSHKMSIPTASFSTEGYDLSRIAPTGPYIAGEDVVLKILESNTGDCNLESVITITAKWSSPDPNINIFGNSNVLDNATIVIEGDGISASQTVAGANYSTNTDGSVTFDIPAHILPIGASGKERTLTLHIPESLYSTGNISFTFDNVQLSQSGGGFSDEFDPPAANLDCSVRVGWAASNLTANNGKTLMGFLTSTETAGKYGIVFEFPFSTKTSAMKDFSSKSASKWSHYKGSVINLTFIEGMTSIGDHAFPEFSKVTSVNFPSSVTNIGTYAFYNSGLEGELIIPATVKNIESLAFGYLPKVNEITFLHTSNSLSLPENKTYGNTEKGAFYVPSHVDTTVNTSVIEIMYGYGWHDTYDNRRLIPILEYQNYWLYTNYDIENDIFEQDVDFDLLQHINFVDYYIPDGTELSSWDASDATVPGTVTAYLSADKSTVTLAGNGYGLVFANPDSSYAFYYLEYLETISNADIFDTRKATTFDSMFMECRNLTSVEGIETWNTNLVVSTSGMFYDCGSLVSVDLSKDTYTAKNGTGNYLSWNTCVLEDASSMFMMYGYHENVLKTVDTTGWDTSNLKYASYMFGICYSLEEIIGLPEWNVGNLIDAYCMFLGDEAIKELDVSKWNPKNLQDAGTMFGGCEGVTELDISGWDMSNITDSSYMLRAVSFETLTLPVTLSVIGEGFAMDCPNLKTIIFNQPSDMKIDLPNNTGNDDGAFYLYNNGEDSDSDAYVSYTPVKPLRTTIITSNQDVLKYNWSQDCRGYIVTTAVAEHGTLTTEPSTTYNAQTKTVVINGATVTLKPAAASGYTYNGSTVNYTDEAGTVRTFTVPSDKLSFEMPAGDATITPSFILGGPALSINYPLGNTYGTPTFTSRTTCIVTGTVSDDVCGVASVTVNGRAATINSDGTWSCSISIAENSTATVTVIATNTAGRTTTEKRYVRHGSITITYDSNDGSFTSGPQNIVEYIPSTPKLSKTGNINDSGTATSSSYPANLETTDIITIPGASELEVTVTYQTHNTSYDWLAIYDGSVTPTADNYNASLYGKLGGTSKTTITFTVPGDTVQFFFKSNNNYNYYYGYYAVVKEKEIISGSYSEPVNDGYSFDGWYTDIGCTEGHEFDLYNTFEDTTVYAKWTDNIWPEITVTTPSGSQSSPTYVSSSTLTVCGTVFDLGSGINSLTVNNHDVPVNEDGTWSYTYELDEGYNLRVRVIATDNAGNTNTTNRYVHYDASAPVLTLSIPESATSTNPMNTYSDTLTVTGSVVDKGCGLKSFTLNGSEVEVSSDGNWSVDLAVSGETTELVFVAVDAFDYTITETRYIYFAPLTVTYNANGGTFTSGTTNIVTYKNAPVVKISKTPNVSADGTSHSGGYGDNQEVFDEVTIPGATHLSVAITYATEGAGWDWVAIYDGTIIPSAGNYNNSISDRLGGTSKTTSSFIVPGDTVRFFFRSDVSNSNYYGYYATVTGYALSDIANVYEDPTLTGYEFAGWYTDAGCTDGNEFDINTLTGVNSITVYAKYIVASNTFAMSTGPSNSIGNNNGDTPLDSDIFEEPSDTPVESEASVTPPFETDNISPDSSEPPSETDTSENLEPVPSEPEVLDPETSVTPDDGSDLNDVDSSEDSSFTDENLISTDSEHIDDGDATVNDSEELLLSPETETN